MSARRFLRLLLLIGLVAAGLRIAHIVSIRDTAFYRFDETWTASDMHSNRAWAHKLVDGDWLDREAYRPYFQWQDRVASRETWRRWLGPSTYYQPPLYAYALAVGLKVAGSLDDVRWLQALLGAANILLIGLLGRRLASPGAGLIAALLAAAYAPYILYDAEILRGTLVITLHLLALLALHAAAFGGGAEPEGAGEGGRAGTVQRRIAAPLRGPTGAWILAGFVLGAAYLGSSAIITFIPLAILWAVLTSRPGGEGSGEGASGAGRAWWRPGLLRAALLVGGILLALIPLVIRNAAVGAPLLSCTTRGPLAFIMGNAPGAMPVGAAIPDSTVEILRASDYRLVGTMVETLRAHDGDIGSILVMQWEKLRGLFNSYEVPDNPSFYYAALHSPVLAWGLRFSCISGLGLVGLILSARRHRRHLLAHLYVVGTLSLFLFAPVVSRYRQPLVIPLVVYAGFAVTEAWRAVRGHRFLLAASVLAGSLLVSLALPRTPPPGYRYYRQAEFLVAAGYFSEKGDVDGAGREIKQAIDLAYREHVPAAVRIELGLGLGELYARNARYPEALSAYRQVLEDDPRNAEALAVTGAIHQEMRHPMRALQMLLRAEQADPRNREVQARLGHLYWFVFEDGARALAHLRNALELDPRAPDAARLSALAAQISAATGATP